MRSRSNGFIPAGGVITAGGPTGIVIMTGTVTAAVTVNMIVIVIVTGIGITAATDIKLKTDRADRAVHFFSTCALFCAGGISSRLMSQAWTRL